MSIAIMEKFGGINNESIDLSRFADIMCNDIGRPDFGPT